MIDERERIARINEKFHQIRAFMEKAGCASVPEIEQALINLNTFYPTIKDGFEEFLPGAIEAWHYVRETLLRFIIVSQQNEINRLKPQLELNYDKHT